MGEDKSEIRINGVSISERIRTELDGIPITVLGNRPLPGCAFLPDGAPSIGPAAALANLQPAKEFVIVLSCDLPLFDKRLCEFLFQSIAGYEAAIPEIGGMLQPLCALYRKHCFGTLPAIVRTGKGPMAWAKNLNAKRLAEKEFVSAGLRIESAMGANTREELDRLRSL